MKDEDHPVLRSVPELRGETVAWFQALRGMLLEYPEGAAQFDDTMREWLGSENAPQLATATGQIRVQDIMHITADLFTHVQTAMDRAQVRRRDAQEVERRRLEDESEQIPRFADYVTQATGCKKKKKAPGSAAAGPCTLM